MTFVWMPVSFFFGSTITATRRLKELSNGAVQGFMGFLEQLEIGFKIFAHDFVEVQKYDYFVGPCQLMCLVV